MRQSGFTLVELVATIIIVGILAIVALPRFFNQTDFDGRGFNDETLSTLRFAQKTAVAQRRQVCATFTASTVILRIATTFGGACDRDIVSPNGTTPYQITARTGVTFNPTPAALSFNPDGSVSAAASIQVNGMPNLITVVMSTGYVY